MKNRLKLDWMLLQVNFMMKKLRLIIWILKEKNRNEF